MKKAESWIYLGIDQTGAIYQNGRQKGQPKPLPSCLIEKDQIHFFYLKSLSQKDIESHIDRKKFKRLLICADCVLGLPESMSLSWRQALSQIQNFDAFGRIPASQFFKSLGKGKVPRRAIEIECKANSVFQEKPFQKNIQTGTFRLWKEMSKNESDFYVPALEVQKDPERLRIYEGYPSLSWKLLLSAKKRQPEALRVLLQRKGIKVKFQSEHSRLVKKDPNLADALLLALTIQKYRTDALSLKPHIEGSILGLKHFQKMEKSK